jgi:DNA-binding transcriptional ArsR family regulator
VTEDIKMEPKAEPDLRLLRTLAHPLRHRILQALNLRVASPSELAEELELPLPNVAYHVKVLAQNDAIELVKTEPVRGALEHFYRATMRPWWTDEVWAELPVSTRRAIFGEILSDIWTDINAAAEAHEFDHPTTQVTRTWLDLDDEAYDKLTEKVNGFIEYALELHAEAAPRLAAMPDDQRKEHRTALMLLHFHRAPTDHPGALHGGRVETTRGSGAAGKSPG